MTLRFSFLYVNWYIPFYPNYVSIRIVLSVYTENLQYSLQDYTSVLLRYDSYSTEKSVLDTLLDMKSVDSSLRDARRPSKDSMQNHNIDEAQFFLTSVPSLPSDISDEKWMRDTNILKEFVQHILVYVVGKKHYTKIGMISKWSTVSDEALALLILENCEEKWKEEKVSGTVHLNGGADSSKRKRGE